MFLGGEISTLSGLLFSFFGALGGIILVYQAIQKWFLYERRLLKTISKLATTTTIEYFVSLLGSPVFATVSQGLKQHIFVDPRFYVEAVADSDGQVLMFSVTIRRKSFNPALVINKGGRPSINVKLGVTRFSDLDDLGEGAVRSGLGAHRVHYQEEYYLGNPGLYQAYAFSLNDAGVVPKEFKENIFNLGAEVTSDPRLQTFRSHTRINTYTIVAPHKNLSDLGDFMRTGADYDQVRLLNL